MRVKNLKFKYVFPTCCFVLALALEVLATGSEAFAVFYTDNIFPVITVPLAFISGLFPFSVGEILIELGAVLLAVALIASLVAAAPGIAYYLKEGNRVNRRRMYSGNDGSLPLGVRAPAVGAYKPSQLDEPSEEEKKENSSHLTDAQFDGISDGKNVEKKPTTKWGWFIYYYKKYMTLVWFLFGVYLLIMVLNCFILYQYPPMIEEPSKGASVKAQFSKEQTDATYDSADLQRLTELRDLVVLKANDLATKMERNEKGEVIGKSREELESTSKASMQKLSEEGYSRLSGYYPPFKYFNDSKFFSKQDMAGYYFPYTMEANVNKIMYSTNFPHSICHELSHLKGYLLEDEANFIGYLACMESGDELFEYSALLSVLGYLDNDFYDGLGASWYEYMQHPIISDAVLADDIFLTDEVRAMVDDSGVLDSEKVKKASNEFTETILTSNGVSDGMKSYSRVVRLLLDYYSQRERLGKHFG